MFTSMLSGQGSAPCMESCRRSERTRCRETVAQVQTSPVLACETLAMSHMLLYRLAKEDFELHGKRIKQGSTILTSMLYAKASDPRMSAGDHELQSVPLHMDIHQLQASVKPERWLDPQKKLDMAVSIHYVQQAPMPLYSTTLSFIHPLSQS